MKRLAALLGATALCLCGCIGQKREYVDPKELGFINFPNNTQSATSPTPSNSSTTDEPENSPSPTPAPSPVIDAETLIDEKGVTVHVRSLEFSSGQPSLIFEIDNQTDKNITVYGTDIMVNNTRVSGFFEEDVDAGQSTDQALLSISVTDLEQLQIEYIKSIGLTMSVRSVNSTTVLIEPQPFAIDTLAAPSPANTRAPDDTAIVVSKLVDESDFELSLLQTEKSAKGHIFVNVQFDNKSAKDLSMEIDELKLNGKAVDVHTVLECPPGEAEKDSLWVSSELLEQASITEVESIAFHVRIYDDNGDILDKDVQYSVTV